MCAGIFWLRQDFLEEYMHAWLTPPQMSAMGERDYEKDSRSRD